MHCFSRRAGALLLALLLALPAAGHAESRSTRNLNAIADDYYWALQDRLLRPKLSPQGNRAWLHRIQGFGRRLAHIKASNLDQQSHITHNMLQQELTSQRDFVTKGWINEEINGTESLLHTIVGGADASANRTINDWRYTIKTLRGSKRFVKGYIGLLKQGIEQGRTRSRPVVESAINSLSIMTSSDRRKNPFLALEAQLEQSLKGRPQLPALRRELRQAVKRDALPAHRALKDFLVRDYLPRASRLGADRQRYLHHMATHLGTEHPSPEALNRWGRREVKRLTRELDRTVRKINPNAASTRSFMNGLNRRQSNRYASGDELVQATQKEIIRARGIARGMAPIPRDKVKVTRVAGYQEDTVAAQYTDSGIMEGEMQVNTGRLLRGQRKVDLATLVTHEVYGGHHLAAMYTQKQHNLPAYRQGAANTTYDEGWALYAEAWRDKRGKFTPHERVGFLVNHLWRAARLVVDTGLHTGTMTPRQATDYFRKSAYSSRDTATAEIQRYIDWPGQALAYYEGKRRLLHTKRECRKILGRRFDERRFHAKLLSLGSVPTGEVDRVMSSWARRRAGQLRPTKTRRPSFWGRGKQRRPDRQRRTAAATHR